MPALIVVLDSSVLISVLNTNDRNHPGAEALIRKLSTKDYEIYAPVTYLWDMEAYMRHPDKAQTHSQNTDTAFKVITCDVTSDLFWRTRSSEMAFIKGPDRVFVSLARDQAAPLITNDKQILANADKLGVRAASVEDFLNAHFR